MRIIHFADLHLGVETYGRLNPETGLTTRLEDFLRALDRLVDYSLENRVDLVLFCGDAYKSREPSPTQQREFARRIRRLSSGGVPVFLLVGNHDLPNATGGATTPEIFDTLAVDNVHVSGKPQVHRIPTAGGTVQVVSLPWLRRSALLAREESRSLAPDEINQRLQQVLTQKVNELVRQLDPSLPAILAAHAWVTGVRVREGSEKSMVIGQEPALLLGNVANPAFDYVALGHIHRHQVLNSSPPVVYAGSLERLDFGEEDDEKGFYLVEIADTGAGKRRVSFEFHPLAGRRFLTINASIEPGDSDPTATVLKTIAGHGDRVREAIVRLLISLTPESEGQLRDGEIRNALKPASYFTVARDIRREARLRLGVLTEELTPVEALRKYIESRQDLSPERVGALLKYGERLIQKGLDSTGISR